MKRKAIFVLSLVIILSMGLFYYNTLNSKAADIGTEVGNQAPDFTLKNIYGEKVNLKELQGKKVFLNFWASWCKPCEKEMPDIQKLYKNYGDKIEIIAVNMGEKKKTVMNFLEMRGYNFPILLDSNRELSSKYLVRAVPTSYFLDSEGIIMNKHIGLLNYEQMVEKMNLK